MALKKRKTMSVDKCDFCDQQLLSSDIINYPGHPENAVEEYITLTNPELCLFNGDETNLLEYDQWPQQKITKFCVYDERGHLCPFDTGLVEKNVQLYFSGYVKAIYDDDPSSTGGFPTKDLGPINEWFVSGFEGGKTALVGFNTAFAEYILMEPAEIYAPFMKPVMEKIHTSKAVIEYLLDEIDPSFEDLLNKFDSELLIKHSQFICEQVFSFDTSAAIEDTMLITKSCMRDLINLSGVDLEKPDSHLRPSEEKIVANQIVKRTRQSKKSLTRATTTPLVRDTFETFFRDHLGAVKEPDDKKVRPDEADPENENNSELMDLEEETPKIVQVFDKEAEWIGDPIARDNGRLFYEKANLGGDEIRIRDCVLIEVNSATQVARVLYMFQDEGGNKLIHANWYWRAADTILGETADEFELFYSERCDNIAFNTVSRKVSVAQVVVDNSAGFFCTKRYVESTARFEDPVSICESRVDFCPACTQFAAKRFWNTPRVFEKSDLTGEYGFVKFRNDEFRPGTAVYLKPGTFKFEEMESFRKRKVKDPNAKDEEVYPEFYRKLRVSDTDADVPEPFNIGCIVSIFAATQTRLVPPSRIRIRVKKLYRPENTNLNSRQSRESDLNLLYWSEEEVAIPFQRVVGKCHLAFSGNVGNPQEWSSAGPDRFYFSETYDSAENRFHEPSESAKAIVSAVDYPRVRRLATLDVFAGCGGLSEGLQQSGVAEVKWAIENDASAAKAYGLNHPEVKIFTDDCNCLLSRLTEGTRNEGEGLPIRGEVELLCGGPPCQGFSGMNRFNSREYSFFKNSLVASFLSYCDYYRPRFFIMENVRSFVSFKKNMVLKLTLRCLTRMGYQCTFGVLQAGNYGVPQTRRRMFIIAAASGEVLPEFPEPSHVFSRRCCQLTSVVDNRKYLTNCEWTESAPRRMVTVRDAVSDLPVIDNGASLEVMDYEMLAESEFQRRLRGKVLRDHVCKLMMPLMQARIELIPSGNGADWRDLPNIVVRLSDGTWSKKLEYTYHDERAGKSSRGALRGVCSCCVGRRCNPADKQYNTLIPWCLSHTGNRNNHWNGLFGRLEWDGFFATTITNPEPIGKQGRVLHPEQNRVISVRECARSQGFPDGYSFYGSIVDKYRQVGNAVPPPVARAIGLEIRKCLGIDESL